MVTSKIIGKGLLGHLSLLYLIISLNFAPKSFNAYVTQCGERLPAEREVVSANPGENFEMFFPFFIILFFSCSEIIYRKEVFFFPFLVFKKSSGALKHLYQSIAFELTTSGRFVKEKS